MGCSGQCSSAPGTVNGSEAPGNPSIHGGSAQSNVYLLDGMNITDPVTQTFSTNFNFDAIGELEIITLQGTISPDGVHLHLSFSDASCQVWGGHLEHGTLVLRGADLLDSTTRQIYLQQMLGYTTPRYAHLPVAVNVLGEKLSKQTLAAPIDNRELLATLNAALAFLGQDTITDADPKKIADFWKRAIAGWDLVRVPRQRTQPAPV